MTSNGGLEILKYDQISALGIKNSFEMPMLPSWSRNEAAMVSDISQEDLINKINAMNNWFLRSKVEYRFRGKNEEFILIHFNSSKEFYLNQFHSDFEEFSITLFGKPQYCLKTPIDDWLSLQRDLIYENHTGLIPNPYGKFNRNFLKTFRTAPGSNLQPLIHSEDQLHPLHTH